MLIGGRIAETHLPQLLHQHLPQLQLPHRAGIGRGLLIGLCVDADITAKTVE
jgi:hypothetical protein